MWVTGKFALAAVSCATAALVACSGPLDSPIPRPRVARDAGIDHLRDVAPDRGGDLADRGSSPRDTAPEVIVDAPVTTDAPVEVPPDPWPTVMGCVTGLRPNLFSQSSPEGNPLVVGCGGLNRTLMTIFDTSQRGFIFTAALDPPLAGFELFPQVGMVCNDGQGVPITIVALEDSVRHPGVIGNASVNITMQGPGSPTLTVRFSYSIVTTDFTVVNETIDFGLVPIGTSRSTEVVIANLRTSPAIQNIYPAPLADGPFSIGSGAASRPFPVPLEPGQTGALLTAYFYSTAVGAFATTILLSPFAPGVGPFDPACRGPQRTLTLRGQAYMPRGPIP